MLRGWERLSRSRQPSSRPRWHCSLMNLREPRLGRKAPAHLQRRDPSPQACCSKSCRSRSAPTSGGSQRRSSRSCRQSRRARLREELTLAEAQLAQREGGTRKPPRLFRACTRCGLHGSPPPSPPPVSAGEVARCAAALRRGVCSARWRRTPRSSRSCSSLRPDAARAQAPDVRSRVSAATPPTSLSGIDADAPSAEASPIFIVAFPRSGTTLLEQTLDAHPLLAIDGRTALPAARDRRTSLDHGIDYPERLARADAAQLDEARARYWELTRTTVQLAPGQRLVDKNPLNMLRLPAIRRLFPNAPHRPGDPSSVRCDAELLHAALPRPEFAMHVPGPADARAWLSPQSFDFWYQQAALLRARGARDPLRDFRRGLRDRRSRARASSCSCPGTTRMLAPGASTRAPRGSSARRAMRRSSQPVQSAGRSAAGEQYARHFAPVIPLVRALPRALGIRRLSSEQQVGGDDVLVAGERRQALRAGTSSTAGTSAAARCAAARDRSSCGKARLAALRDVVEIPEKHEVAIGDARGSRRSAAGTTRAPPGR